MESLKTFTDIYTAKLYKFILNVPEIWALWWNSYLGFVNSRSLTSEKMLLHTDHHEEHIVQLIVFDNIIIFTLLHQNCMLLRHNLCAWELC